MGRRLAFDQRRGRLWVVCRKCEKWNLTPLEERWDAIETCERLFRDTRKRVSTENIGLARHSEGLELVRIGEPQRPEFAAWRYGDHFRKRDRRMAGIVAGGAAFGGAVSTGLVGIAAGSVLLTFWFALHSGRGIIRDRRVIARIKDDSGFVHLIRAADAHRSSVVPGDRPYTWAFRVHLGLKDWELLLKGDHARRVAAKVVPHINNLGWSTDHIADAVKHLEECGGPQPYLGWVARYHETRSFMSRQWLGVEMAITEENERLALEHELELLEAAWKEAEEIAAIADRLALPSELEANLSRLRSRNIQAPSSQRNAKDER